MELAAVLPILLLCFCGAVDLGRMIYVYQLVTSFTREAGSLASRGATDAQTIAAIESAQAPLVLATAGRIVVTKIRRHSAGDARPWVVSQTAHGGLAGFTSRVGAAGGPATIPGVASLAPGMTMRAVEVGYRFRTVMTPAALGVAFPSVIYDVAYF